MTENTHRGIWEHPAPVRENGFTWLTVLLAEGAAQVVVTVNTVELADRIMHATDDAARRELAGLLDIEVLPDVDDLDAMEDADLLGLVDTLAILEVAALDVIARRRHEAMT
jgi:hypothetical protein